MPIRFFVTAAFALAASFPLAACREGPATEPTEPSRRAAAVHAARGRAADPRAQAVLAAMEGYKQAILDSDTAALARTWTDDPGASAGVVFLISCRTLNSRATQSHMNLGSLSPFRLSRSAPCW